MDIKQSLFLRCQPEAAVGGVKRPLGPVDIQLCIKSGLRSGVTDARLNRAFVLTFIADRNKLKRKLRLVSLNLFP